jgi:hypothetical protein
VATARAVLQSGYYFAKLLITAIYALIYFRWRVWRAKYAFKAELVRSGIPGNVVKVLVSQYNAQNRKIVSSLTGFTSFKRKRPLTSDSSRDR